MAKEEREKIMTRQDHLLTIIAEECVETAQRATKALRFGLEEVQPGQDMNNAKRIVQEFSDLTAVMMMLAEINPAFGREWSDSIKHTEYIRDKRKKVKHFLEYSAQQGRLEQ